MAAPQQGQNLASALRAEHPPASSCMVYRPSKFSLIALDGVQIEADLPADTLLHPQLRVTQSIPYAIDQHWRDWLGSLTTRRVEHANLFIVYERPTDRPGIYDGEHQESETSVHDLYWCLLLVTALRLESEPVRLSGSVDAAGQSEVRSAGDLEFPVVLQGTPFHTLNASDVGLALRLQRNLAELHRLGLFPRMRRILEAFHAGVHSHWTDFRLHQFVRVLEGFIAPDIGDTKRQFRSRTELFVGPRHHDTMGRLFDLRSQVEHLHDPIGLYSGSRFERYLALWRDSVAVEELARAITRRFLLQEGVWPHFGDDGAVKEFWSPALSPAARRELWGAPLDLDAIFAAFEGKYLDPEDLGLSESDR